MGREVAPKQCEGAVDRNADAGVCFLNERSSLRILSDIRPKKGFFAKINLEQFKLKSGICLFFPSLFFDGNERPIKPYSDWGWKDRPLAAKRRCNATYKRALHFCSWILDFLFFAPIFLDLLFQEWGAVRGENSPLTFAVENFSVDLC